MKKFLSYTTPFALLAVTPLAALAAWIDGDNAGAFDTFMLNVGTFLNEIVIPFMYALLFLAFVWGVFVYFIAGGANEEKRAQGRQLMIYAVIGFVAVTALWAIVAFVYGTIGLDPTLEFDDPGRFPNPGDGGGTGGGTVST